MNIHVSNISTQLQNEELRALFTPFGEVAAAEVSIDAFTEKSRGFGYVEMPNEEEANAAIAALNDTEVSGQKIVVRPGVARQVHKGSYKVGSGPINPMRIRRNK